MSTKKKITQNELRRLMGEQKKKQTVGSKKIESPLAKYDQSGQLTCIVCESVVRSEAVWTVHLNSKHHRENISKKTKRKESPVEVVPVAFKRPTLPPLPNPTPVKLKSILKNSLEVSKEPQIPADFFDSSIKSHVVEVPPSDESASSAVEAMESAEQPVAEDDTNGDQIPEGFFDDPKLDAKVRNVEYKDPVEEEWEQFQKEIKEETSKAQIIISVDQEEATTERQIDEIDEQLRHWSRVVSMEQKKKEAVPLVVNIKTEKEDEAAPDEEFEEYVDWRSKGSFL